MTHDIYTYRFDKYRPFQDLEDTFFLAFLAVESLHGKSRARMDIRFKIDKSSRAIEIDTSTDAGRDLNRIFIGFAAVEYGEDAFQIERTLRLANQKEQSHG